MSDAIAVLIWWILLQILGLTALPLTFRLLRQMPERGYGVSKAVGLLLTSYLFWLLGVLGFLRNDTGSILFCLAVVASLSLFFYYWRSGSAEPPGSRVTLLPWLRANWKLILVTELVFAFTFGGWALYRAYVPRIMTSGGEKFMELAFLNGFQRSATLPPLDPWLSGFAISYYYFGYLMMSILIQLSGVAPEVGFNIGGALLFALTATGAFSLVYNLVARGRERSGRGEGRGAGSVLRPILAALLGVLFVVLLGNWEGPLEVAHWKGAGSADFWQWVDIADLDASPPEQSDSARYTRPGWWWWRASRVISDYNLADWPDRFDKTAAPLRRENIDEFPFFSFLLGDMHPHVLALPFVLLALTVSLTLFQVGSRKLEKWELLSFAVIFGALGFLNTWDLPIQWVVAVAAYTLGRITHQPADSQSIQSESLPGYRSTHLRPILTLAGVLSVGSLLLYAPFYVGFQSQAGGVLAHVHSSSRLTHFGIMFGPLLFVLVAFLAWGLVRTWRQGTLALGAGLWAGFVLLALALGVLVITAVIIAVSPSLRNLAAPGLAAESRETIILRYLAMRLNTPWVTLLLVGMIGSAVALLRSPDLDKTVRFALLLTIAGAVMTLAPEYVYLKDVFGVRLNTIFKFYYQAWILWAVAAASAAYILLFAREAPRLPVRGIFGGGLALAVGLGLVYPLLSILDRVKEFPEAPTLDGIAYFARSQPADYAAIQWLNNYVEGAPVILETPGGAYQYEGRVSAQTGLPTLLGWAGHEHQWRGNTIEEDRRRPAIEELYSTTDTLRTLTLLDEYDITYVYVGPLERSRWPAQGLQKFDQLMDIVYNRDGVTIYKRQLPGGYADE